MYRVGSYTPINSDKLVNIPFASSTFNAANQRHSSAVQYGQEELTAGRTCEMVISIALRLHVAVNHSAVFVSIVFDGPTRFISSECQQEGSDGGRNRDELLLRIDELPTDCRRPAEPSLGGLNTGEKINYGGPTRRRNAFVIRHRGPSESCVG